MDPNLFAIDGERVFEVLVAIIVLSFFIERALAVIFENALLVNFLSQKGLKESIALIVSWLVCMHWEFDALSVLLVREKNQSVGYFLTGAIIAGGSKASIKFFHDVMGAMSNAEKDRQATNKVEREVKTERAARKARGEL